MSKHVPIVESSTKFHFFTSIWMIPVIALLISAWLAYQYFSQLGAEIRIVFPQNEGLKVGQSLIKYKDVSIGVVKKVELQEDGEGVTVIARMDKGAYNYLNENTKFWIVKPEVGLSGISGLETLITGTYINMYTEKGTEFTDTFIGLSQSFRKTNEGEYFHLNAQTGYTVKVGTPIYLKNIKVGYVQHMNIALDDTSIDFIVFIEKFYVPYVHADSKFWVESTFSIDISKGRLDVNLAPITHFVHGGINFSSSGEDANNTVASTHVFNLYPNRGLAKRKELGKGGAHIYTFEIETNASLAKLDIDTLVRYEGYEVGTVKDIKLIYDEKTHKMNASVYVAIDTSSFAKEKMTGELSRKHFHTLIKEGLSARMMSANFITGALFVDLVFNEDKQKVYTVKMGKHYPLIPTIGHESSGLLDGVEQMVAKLNNLPLKKLLASLDKVFVHSDTVVLNANKVVKDTGKVIDGLQKPLLSVVKDLKRSIKNLNKMTNKKSFAQMPDKVNKSLQELNRTLKATRKVVKGYDNNSLLTRQISDTLKVVTKTSKEMQQFLYMLNRKPNSLIFGDK